MVAEITTPYRERHPNVRFTILSRTSIEVLALLENLEIDAGITYLDNEPLGRVTAVPFYEERYRLITSLGESARATATSVTWSEVGSVPLCLLTPDMQNRRIIDGLLVGGGRAGDADAGVEFRHRALLACPHRTLVDVMPEKLASTLGLGDRVRSIPIVEPEAVHTVGLVVPHREPMTPLALALVAEVKRAAAAPPRYVDRKFLSTRRPQLY